MARTRKKRKPAPTHEDLQDKAHKQDLQIQSLLTEFDKLRNETRIRQRMDCTQSDSHSSVSERTRPSETPELAASHYFSRGHNPSRQSPPDIIKYCALYPDEIVDLFSIFFERINPFFSLLDPELHGDPQSVMWTSPFLFTVICAVASRYHRSRPNLYRIAHEFAQEAAAKSLIDDSKSVDVCQALLILGVYPLPKKKWVEDRSWLLMGVAIRMAIELGLDQPPPTSCSEREKLNRTRTWLTCYCVDASHAIQFGKIPMLRLDDYVARTSRDWYKCSPMNMPFDVHICAYVQILVSMAEWRSTVGEGNHSRQGFDVVAAATRTHLRVCQEMDYWVDRYAEQFQLTAHPICAFRGNITQMIAAYLRLVVLAAGFQRVAEEGISQECDILKQSIDAARAVIQIVVEKLYPTGKLRYAMESHFLYVSFAAAYLINLLRPKFLPLLDHSTQQRIIRIVTRLIEVLGSEDVALDGRHTPALYSRFLSSLLSKYRQRAEPSYSNSRSSSPRAEIYPQHKDERFSTPPDVFSWPDTGHVHGYPRVSPGFMTEVIIQQPGELEMDFSLSHFIRTVKDRMSPIYDEDKWGEWNERGGPRQWTSQFP